MKSIFRRIILLILSLMLILLSACGTSGDHIGTWCIDFGQGVNECVFKSDGTFTFTWHTGEQSAPRHYEISDTTKEYTELLVTVDGTNTPALFRVYENVMVNISTILTYSKENYTSDDMFGSWYCLGSIDVLNIFKDGSLKIGASEHTYIQNGNLYQVFSPNDKMCKMVFVHNGNSVTLMIGNVFEKKHDTSVQA